MIIVGLGFGDEGKGLSTSFFVSRSKNPIVVRFNGGQQAGHTVNYKNHSHVFSNFGSGTLQGAPTLWSQYCTFSPVNYHNELNNLKESKFFIHALCPVTTPYDVLFNQRSATSKSHGTCGMGFGATLQRHEQHYKLYAQDLFSKTILKQKLAMIAEFYKLSDVSAEPFIDLVQKIIPTLNLITDYAMLNSYSPLFEGAQGVLLDQDFGFFPHVTRSNTTSKNALSIFPCGSICYVTRTYQTRHGNGPMTNEGAALLLDHTEMETNVSNKYQGNFRRSLLDLDLLNYSIKCDSNYSKKLEKNLIITCVDQTGDKINVTHNEILKTIDVKDILNYLNADFGSVYLSFGPSIDTIKKIK